MDCGGGQTPLWLSGEIDNRPAKTCHLPIWWFVPLKIAVPGLEFRVYAAGPVSRPGAIVTRKINWHGH
jgi:hypothetical protein